MPFAALVGDMPSMFVYIVEGDKEGLKVHGHAIWSVDSSSEDNGVASPRVRSDRLEKALSR